MAQYTMELWQIAEKRPLFNFPYPFYDEKKRREFESAFIRHFYFREICCDEPEKFLWFLRDKMTTVFPYYNELLRTATIEYSIENPYNLTETYTRKTDSMDKANSGSYAVGRTEDERETKSNSNGTINQTGSETETSGSEREANARNDGTKTVEGTVENSFDKVQKYLDTPQGKLDLNKIDYLTNLTQNIGEEATENNSSESSTDTRTDTETSSGNRNAQNTASSDQETHTTETATGAQRTTADSNSRSEAIGQRTEEYTMRRYGNIGVNPATYEIDAHINTQKTLKRIYQMFFDECEDLFMLVY